MLLRWGGGSAIGFRRRRSYGYANRNIVFYTGLFPHLYPAAYLYSLSYFPSNTDLYPAWDGHPYRHTDSHGYQYSFPATSGHRYAYSLADLYTAAFLDAHAHHNLDAHTYPATHIHSNFYLYTNTERLIDIYHDAYDHCHALAD